MARQDNEHNLRAAQAYIEQVLESGDTTKVAELRVGLAKAEQIGRLAEAVEGLVPALEKTDNLAEAVNRFTSELDRANDMKMWEPIDRGIARRNRNIEGRGAAGDRSLPKAFRERLDDVDKDIERRRGALGTGPSGTLIGEEAPSAHDLGLEPDSPPDAFYRPRSGHVMGEGFVRDLDRIPSAQETPPTTQGVE